MIIKKIVLIENSDVFGIKFDDAKNLCLIGGCIRLREVYESVISAFFGIDEDSKKFPEFHIVTNGKGTFTFDCTWLSFKKSIREMEEHGYTIRNVTKHGNLLR